jgi:hypothetical protein
MPMMPTPRAALIYTAVKMVGYAVFALGFNKVVGKTVSPYKFGVAKTALGLLGGIAYIGLALAVLPAELSGTALYLFAIPVRLLVWGVALGIFYGFRTEPKILYVAMVLGVAWSYLLDGALRLLDKILPGMSMPWC